MTMASSAGRILLFVLAGVCGALIEGFVTHRGLPSTRSLLVCLCGGAVAGGLAELIRHLRS
ncbi:hypothetical protein AB0I51_03100 [Streptomyces sp. NPDC050549]|uniref:hypothetical protein n=1 Tax=Streptomyces sp. NPDC050549 TaxID=3155406 RepID=UPI00342AC6F5